MRSSPPLRTPLVRNQRFRSRQRASETFTVRSIGNAARIVAGGAGTATLSISRRAGVDPQHRLGRHQPSASVSHLLASRSPFCRWILSIPGIRMGVVQSAPLAEEVDHRTGRRISRIASSASRLINSRKVPPEVPWLQAVSAGSEKPLGCSFLRDDVVNFAIYSTEAKHMTLIVYHPEHETEVAESMSQMAHIEDEQEGEDDGDGEEEPESSSESLTFEALDTCVELKLDPRVNRTGNVWHVAIQPALAMYRYAWRVGQGKKAQLVMDPYARLLSSPRCIDFGAREKRHNSYEPRAVIPPRDYLHGFDWQEVKSPDIPPSDWIVYEVHVRSFTALARDTAAPPGSYAAVIEKIPYLKSLGVNCVELLPVFEFNELEWERRNPNTGEDLCQYWGYSTVAFFAPMNRYSAVGCSGGAVGHSGRLSFQRRSLSLHRRRLRFRSVLDEFRTMVRELHRAGIKVILDVVFNHTAETWRIYHFRALANHDYYLHSEGKDVNFSGCGHTVACNRLVVVEFIRDSLKYWTEEMHVDGFRFDLAATLARSPSPPFAPMKYPTLMTALSRDPSLQHVLLIAEPWDIGAYLVGHFPHYGCWAEWNGRYRDTVRRFIGGEPHLVGDFATRLCGSEDLYANGRQPWHSINFVTAHDGFTLYDLVAYAQKHNEGNGEGNQDGESHNNSNNCGFEGDGTRDEQVYRLRQKQMRNFFVALLLSVGTPMLLMGDEYGHSRGGNNNAWCQDNALNHFDWAAAGRDDRGLLRFVRLLIRFRRSHAFLNRYQFVTRTDVQWVHADWHEAYNYLVMRLVDGERSDDVLVGFNAGAERRTVSMPPLPDGRVHQNRQHVRDAAVERAGIAIAAAGHVSGEPAPDGRVRRVLAYGIIGAHAEEHALQRDQGGVKGQVVRRSAAMPRVGGRWADDAAAGGVAAARMAVMRQQPFTPPQVVLPAR
eukprot:ctg_1779.g512